jgi:hypothetical protein
VFIRISRGDLKEEPESEITAAQDQALQAKYHTTKILQSETDNKFNPCQKYD